MARFQTDPDCGLFLISLKAGGVGPNLTAADYERAVKTCQKLAGLSLA